MFFLKDRGDVRRDSLEGRSGVFQRFEGSERVLRGRVNRSSSFRRSVSSASKTRRSPKGLEWLRMASNLDESWNPRAIFSEPG